MKKLLIVTLLILSAVFAVPSTSEAKTQTVKKTILTGKSYTIYSPAFNKKISSVKISKKYKKYVTVKSAKNKKSFTIKGKKPYNKTIPVTFKSDKKSYCFKLSVVSLKKPKKDTTEEKTTEDNTEDTVDAYHNNDAKCICGGSWEKYYATDNYKPEYWFLGTATGLKNDTPQEWTFDKISYDCYYPLNVRAVLEDYDYNNSKVSEVGWNIYQSALSYSKIPKNYNGISLLQGSIYSDFSDTSVVQWVTDRGGKYATMSVNNYAKTVQVDTGYYRCAKCGAIKQ